MRLENDEAIGVNFVSKEEKKEQEQQSNDLQVRSIDKLVFKTGKYIH